MRIDLEKMRIYGDDTSSYIETMVYGDGDLVGFNKPFPVLLFDNFVDRSKLEGEIVSGDYKFRFISPELNHGDWWVIIATLNEENIKGGEKQPHAGAKILYSLENGILSINLSSTFDRVINLIPCDKKTLKYKDIKSIIKNVETMAK